MSYLALLVLCSGLGTVFGDVCKLEWEHFENSCYAFGETKVSWADAQDFCRAAGGKLAEIETSVENEFLKGQVANRNDGMWWIGGTDVFHEGVWMWISTGEVMPFTDWHAGDPNDASSNEDCVLLWDAAHNHQWADWHCTGETYFICEAEAGEAVVG